MSRYALAAVALCATTALANGRPPGLWSVTWSPIDANHIMVGATFGALESRDGGTTWRWLCEDAVGYGGVYDPDYAFSNSGALFATTTIRGLRVRTDDCTFAPTILGDVFVSHVERTTAGMVVSVASAGDSQIYRTTDDGATFAASAPGLAGDWWESLEAAPSNRARVYLSGFRVAPGGRTNLLFRSADGGETFTALDGDFFPVSDLSALSIAAIHPTNPDIVIARVERYLGSSQVGDALFRSTDGGATWTLVLTTDAFVNGVAIWPNGMTVVGAGTAGWWRATDGVNFVRGEGPDATFVKLAPDESSLWIGASFLNDGMAIGSSTDGEVFSKVMTLSEIAAPVSCPAGTEQFDRCERQQWCTLRLQVGVVADPTMCERPDANPSGNEGGTVVNPPGGCCGVGGGASGLLWAVPGGLLLGRRRRKI